MARAIRYLGILALAAVSLAGLTMACTFGQPACRIAPLPGPPEAPVPRSLCGPAVQVMWPIGGAVMALVCWVGMGLLVTMACRAAGRAEPSRSPRSA
jgi:hypothetical protein